MTLQKIACESPEGFKAFASVSSSLAAPIAKTCKNSAQRNILMIAGTADEFNFWCKEDHWSSKEIKRAQNDREDHCSWMDKKVSGSTPKEGDVLSLLGTRNFWAHQNSCALQLKVFKLPDFVKADQTHVKSVSYMGCTGGSLEFYAIQDGGHQWAGHMSVFASGKNNFDIDATKRIWKFFNKTIKDNP